MLTSWAKRALKIARSFRLFKLAAISAVRIAVNVAALHWDFVYVGVVSCKLPNKRTLRIWSRGDDRVSNLVYWRGLQGYEPETVKLFFRLATRAHQTFDIGAYTGYYTLLAALANDRGFVYAFEPVEAIFERLQENVELNRLANVRCIAAAAGDRAGTEGFYHLMTHAELPMISGLSPEFVRSWGDVRSTQVEVITLDEFVRENNLDRVDLIKIDTETTEPSVLQGMMGTLRRDRPFIICEVHKGRGTEVLIEQILDPLGYNYYLLTPRGPVHSSRIEGHPEWLNYLFTTLSPEEVSAL